jgi:thiol-disulfide isomerase/thioredoxin
MKNIVYLSIIFLTIMFISCDKVNKNDVIKSRQDIVDPGPVDDTISFPDSVNRVAFLEDYTGHTCGNCPKAHDKAQELYVKYPGKIIIGSIHCSSFSNTFPVGAPKYTYKFWTLEGKALDNLFKCSLGTGLPKGMINRRQDNSGAFPLDYGQWEAAIVNEFSKKSVIKIESKATLDTVNNKIDLSAKIKYLQTVTDTLNFSVYVVEDSIVAWQTDYSKPLGSQDVQFYTHRHVFRKAIGGEIGETISSATKLRKDSLVKTYAIPLDPIWNKKKLSIVTFVSRKSTNVFLNHKVLQSNELKVK